MTPESSPEGKIRVANPGHFVCAIFDPPLKDREKKVLTKGVDDYVAPIGMAKLKVGDRACHLLVWRENQFGWSEDDRLDGFLGHVAEEYAERLTTRRFKPKPVDLGEKALKLFKKMEKDHQDEKRKLSEMFHAKPDKLKKK